MVYRLETMAAGYAAQNLAQECSKARDRLLVPLVAKL